MRSYREQKYVNDTNSLSSKPARASIDSASKLMVFSTYNRDISTLICGKIQQNLIFRLKFPFSLLDIG